MPTKPARKTTTKAHIIPRTVDDGPVYHPGELLREVFLDDLKLTQGEAAKRLGTTIGNLNQILTGKRAISADMALKLEGLTGYGARAWLNLQTVWDLKQARARAQRVA